MKTETVCSLVGSPTTKWREADGESVTLASVTLAKDELKRNWHLVSGF
jgi:hypothetical protein